MGEPILTETRHGGHDPLVINGLEDPQARVGQEPGVSSWRTVQQADIATFATLTGDEQWIHVDPERAKAGPPQLAAQFQRRRETVPAPDPASR